MPLEQVDAQFPQSWVRKGVVKIHNGQNANAPYPVEPGKMPLGAKRVEGIGF